MAFIARCAVFTILIALISFVNSKAINDLLTEDSMQRYFSVSSIEEVPEYEIINPVSTGRRRRSIDGSEYPNKHEVKFTAFGEDYHMKLWKNTDLVRPGSMAEYVHENGTVISKPIVKHCYYFGELASHSKSRAAISTCNGFSGIFSHDDTDVYIQPLQEDHAERVRRRRHDIENPHVIFRRSVGDLPNNETDETREMKEHVCGNDARYYHDANNNNDMAKPVPKMGVEKEATRTKRQASNSIRYLELLVVADYQMLIYHGNNVEDYTLTLMNIAASRYMDPTLGTYVKLYITKLLILEGNTVMMPTPTGGSVSLTVQADAGTTLPIFCQFQKAINPSQDSDPNHWDNAVLISRFNLNLYGNGNLLGLASLWSTCTPDYQCSMNEESGLAAGLTITHEIGHTLGISHDDDNQCEDRVNIMSSSRTYGTGSYAWSQCSRDQLNIFFSNSVSDCTKDVPSASSPGVIQTETDQLPGTVYDADDQCRLVFDNSYRECPHNPNPTVEECAYLWCYSPQSSQCAGTGSARMDGTSCGAGQICMLGACVYSSDAQEPINGVWSAYDPDFGTCSRTCGGGVQFKYRYCNNPAPTNGGADCVGDDQLFMICNSQPCTQTQEDFRNEQCASTNTQPFNNQYLQWTGYTNNLEGNRLCEFLCVSNTNTVTTRGGDDGFADGTRCDLNQPNSGKLCVKGECIEFGCDGIPNSSLAYDKCGVCGGTETTCTEHSGTATEESASIATYFKILTIAAGATSVNIYNLNSQSHMAVKINDQYVIGGNGNLRPTAMEYKYNTQSLYYNNINPELITVPGRTTDIIEIEVYMYGPSTAQVFWEYYLPNGVNPVDPEPEVPTYQWVTKNEFTECSVTCGQGTRSRMVACVSNNGVEVDDVNCNNQAKPTPANENCQLPNCPTVTTYRWVTTNEFAECSVTCGQGTRSRMVACLSNDDVEVDDVNCNNQARPTPVTENCQLPNCPTVTTYRWVTTNEFTECSVTCGQGTRSRRVVCVRNDNVVVDDVYCNNQVPPTVTENCQLPNCPTVTTYRWFTTNEFAECSVTCGQGTRSRRVACIRNDNVEVNDVYCNSQAKPTPVTENCQLPNCPTVPTYQWFNTNEFTECSVTCGQGTRSRSVVCIRNDNVEVDDVYCNNQVPPTPAIEICQLLDCPSNGIYLTGPFGQCSTTCGAGIRTRQIYCVRRIGNGYTIAEESSCDQSERPSEQEPCNKGPCTTDQGVWVIGQWTSCSASCGGGFRSRTVYCKQSPYSNIYLIESECPSGKPSTQEACNIAVCPTSPPTNPPSLDEVCNVVLTDSSTRILVANTNGEYCNTTIVAPINQRIVLMFKTVNVNCVNGGTFIIKDGSSVYTVCSSPNNQAWPRSRTNVMEIAAITTQNNEGYEISFRFEAVNDQSDGCDSIQTTEVGAVSSPNYPSNYPPNTDCFNYIVAPPGKRVSISFTAFNIEYHPRCGYDSVRIKDLESYYTIYYCSYRQPFTWVSSTNKVQVQFHSDPALEKSGFYATYTFV